MGGLQGEVDAQGALLLDARKQLVAAQAKVGLAGGAGWGQGWG